MAAGHLAPARSSDRLTVFDGCALDHPEHVERLVVLVGLPDVEHLDRLDLDFALTWWHRFFFAQTNTPRRPRHPEGWYRVDRGEMGAEEAPDASVAAMRRS